MEMEVDEVDLGFESECDEIICDTEEVDDKIVESHIIGSLEFVTTSVFQSMCITENYFTTILEKERKMCIVCFYDFAAEVNSNVECQQVSNHYSGTMDHVLERSIFCHDCGRSLGTVCLTGFCMQNADYCEKFEVKRAIVFCVILLLGITFIYEVWYAPESLRDGKFSVRSDVWSYGVTMCEMFNYGEEPNLTFIDEKMEGPQQQILLLALEGGARFPCPPNCPKAVYIRIIYPCWHADPHERPLFSKLTLEIEDLLNQY